MQRRTIIDSEVKGKKRRYVQTIVFKLARCVVFEDWCCSSWRNGRIKQIQSDDTPQWISAWSRERDAKIWRSDRRPASRCVRWRWGGTRLLPEAKRGWWVWYYDVRGGEEFKLSKGRKSDSNLDFRHTVARRRLQVLAMTDWACKREPASFEEEIQVFGMKNS